MSVLKQRVVVTGAEISAAMVKMFTDGEAMVRAEDGELGLDPETKRRLKGSGLLYIPRDKPDAKAIGDLFAKSLLFYLKER